MFVYTNTLTVEQLHQTMQVYLDRELYDAHNAPLEQFIHRAVNKYVLKYLRTILKLMKRKNYNLNGNTLSLITKPITLNKEIL